jgi:ATP-dependent Clp protease ATP-binding subunit ClpA
VTAAVYSDRYISDRFLPDKAIDQSTRRALRSSSRRSRARSRSRTSTARS